jgi:hypothetical protein
MDHFPLSACLRASALCVLLAAGATACLADTAATDASATRSEVRRAAAKFRNLLCQGRVRLLNGERERAQIEGLCADGRFVWPLPPAAPARAGHKGAASTDPPPARESPAAEDGGGPRVPPEDGGALAPSQPGADGESSPSPAASPRPAPVPRATEPPAELFVMLNALAERSTEQKPLLVMSLLRPPYRTARYSRQTPTNPHALGIAVDIAGFGGHTISTTDPEEEVQALLSLLKALPPGRYRLGLPKAPEAARAPAPTVPVPDDVTGDPVCPLPAAGADWRTGGSLPSRGGRRQVGHSRPPVPPGDDTLPSPAQPAAPAWPFFPPPQQGLGARGKVVTLFANEHYAPEEQIVDARIRKGLLEARKRGADVFAVFPDGINHVHVDVRQTP